MRRYSRAPQYVMKISKYMADRKNRAKLAPAKKKRDAEKKRRKKEGLAELDTAVPLSVQILVMRFVRRVMVSSQAGADG